MQPLDIFKTHERETLHNWLAETGELYVDVYYPRSASGGTPYFVRSLQDLSDLIRAQTWNQVVFTIFRRLQYPLRGIVNEGLIQKALDEITDGEWYAIVSLDAYYPSPCAFKGSGDNHSQLLEELEALMGSPVGIGKNPFDYHDDLWFRDQPDEVLHISVRKTKNGYEPFNRYLESNK